MVSKPRPRRASPSASVKGEDPLGLFGLVLPLPAPTLFGTKAKDTAVAEIAFLLETARLCAIPGFREVDEIQKPLVCEHVQLLRAVRLEARTLLLKREEDVVDDKGLSCARVDDRFFLPAVESENTFSLEARTPFSEMSPPVNLVHPAMLFPWASPVLKRSLTDS